MIQQSTVNEVVTQHMKKYCIHCVIVLSCVVLQQSTVSEVVTKQISMSVALHFLHQTIAFIVRYCTSLYHAAAKYCQ